jgi:hypothetical protein
MRKNEEMRMRTLVFAAIGVNYASEGRKKHQDRRLAASLGFSL